MALAGFRGGAAAYQLAFAGAETEVDLQLEPPPPSTTEWRLFGQVASDDEATSVIVEVALAGQDTVIARTTTDEHGVFSLAAPAGSYDLVVTMPERVLVLPDLDVG
jgi:hypothetical protein